MTIKKGNTRMLSPKVFFYFAILPFNRYFGKKKSNEKITKFYRKTKKIKTKKLKKNRKEADIEGMQIQKNSEGVFFLAKVLPGSSKNQIVGVEGDAIKIRIKGAPEKGKANHALIKFLAKSFEIGSSSVQICSGETSRLKRIFLRGISEAVFWEKIRSLAGARN